MDKTFLKNTEAQMRVIEKGVKNIKEPMNKEIKVYEIKVGDIFTEQKSRELIEYLKALEAKYKFGARKLAEGVKEQTKQEIIEKIEKLPIALEKSKNRGALIHKEDIINLLK